MGITVNDVTVDESQTFARFTVRLSQPSAQTVSVNYTTAGINATGSGYDFANTSGVLTFTPGQTLLTVDVPITAYQGLEGTEFFKLVLTNAVNSTIDTPFGLGTIIDNDAPAGTPVIRVADQVVDESAGTVSFVVTLDRPSTGTVKVNVATANGTATAGTDYTALPTQTLTFLAGETAKTVTVALTNDALAEGAEHFDLVLSSAVGGTLTTQPGRATIGANDAPTVASPLISVSDPTADEASASIDFVVSLSAPSTQQVKVNYNTVGINATGSAYDFENTSGTLTFVAGETTKVVKVPLTAYQGLEGTEFLQLNLTGAVNGTIVENFGLGTIIDNDAPAGTPVIRVADQVVDESAGTVSFVVTLDRPSTGQVKVNVATANGTATAGTDYTALPTQTLTFLAGETAKTVTVALTNDASAESAEHFNLVLSSAVGGTLTTQPGRATIGANDAPTVASPLISVSDPTADEASASIDFVVSLSAPSTQQVKVNYNTVGINATGSAYDFENTSGTLTFVAGETTKVVKVPLSAYQGLEGTEFLQLNLTGAVNGTIVENFGLGTIIDNDAPAGTPVIRVADQVVDESAGTVSFVVTLDRPSTGQVKVNVATANGTATAGTDYTALPTQTLTFLAGETAKTVTVALTNDASAESAEHFNLVLSSAVGGTLTTQPGRATIGANDAPTVASPLISVSDPTADEASASIDFVVSLSAPSTQQVKVNYNTVGINATGSAYDFENTSGTLTFVAGETTKVVKVPLSAYQGLEGTEFLQLNLTGAVNGTIVENFGLGTIIDNDAPAGTPVIRVADQVVDESAGTVSFVVTLDRPSTGQVKVNVATANGTATAGTDYTALPTQTLTFLAGETAKTVTVALTNDAVAESAEHFDLKLSTPVGGTVVDTNGRAYIGPSDAPIVASPLISVSDPTADEASASIDFVVSLSAPSTQQVKVNYNTVGINATGSAYDFENTSGTLTFVAGETTKVVKVPLSAYQGLEGTEFLQLNLTGAVNGTIVENFGLGTIIDNDAVAGAPKLSVSDAIFDESGTFATFVVSLDRPSTGQVKVNAATADATALAGSDYGAAGTQTLVFLPGEVARTVTVSLLNDTLAEGAEFFDLVLSSAVGATIDDVRGHAYLPRSEGATVASPSISATSIAAVEGSAFLQFQINLSAPSAAAVKVNYVTGAVTATGSGYDFTNASGTLTFAPGQTVQTLTVPIIEDALVEGNETFKLTLSGAVGGTIASPTVVATIIDNDGAPATAQFTNTGTPNADILVGRAGSNIVVGSGGNDLLDGVTGVVMTGGAGDDVYIVEAATDTLTEAAAAGTDTVVSYLAAYTLGVNVENLVLGSGGAKGTGNTLANSIIGNSGANTLDGLTGADAMRGLAGNDIYVVDNAGDTTVEAAGGGTDTVNASLSWTLAAQVENLVLTGSAAINGSGNELANTLTGNSAINRLTGGAGNDTYVVQTVGDTTIEVAGGGTDTVQSSITWTLASEVENLTLTGAAAINGSGNALSNTLTGNSAINQLTGGAGDDTYVVQTVGDTTVEAAAGGTDTVQSSISWTLATQVENLTLTGTAAINGNGNTLANVITGNAGANVLNGSSGNDTLIGGGGIDSLTGGTGLDNFVFTSPTGIDTVTDFKAIDDTFRFSAATIPVGNADTVVDGGLVRAAAGGFSTAAELVVFTSNIVGGITSANAAAKIGSATGAYAIGADVLFAVDNGTQTGIFLFQSAGADALVSAAELTQLALVNGDVTGLTDYAFGP